MTVEPGGPSLNDRLRTFLVITVGLGWVFNLVAPSIVDSYDGSLAANGPLLLILGSLFAVKRSSK